MGRIGLRKDAVGDLEVHHVACEGTLDDSCVCGLNERCSGDAAMRRLEAIETTEVGWNADGATAI
jgi:hypothetical protein